MRQKSLRSAGVALVFCAAVGSGCAPTVQVHGYMPRQADISRIRPGFDDAASVEEILGQPSSSGVLRDSAWYYVQSTVESFTWHAPRVVDRTVLAVQFDQNGVVRGVARYGLEDGRIIDLTTRTTETGGREMGVLEQLFGNLLNLDAEQFQEQ
jgi:outer membrane protein assembly factor BamE (lipoprotein component of BamABCDE complex)